MMGLSTSGSISFGWAFVAGRKRVPSPAAGMTALRTRRVGTPTSQPPPDGCAAREACGSVGTRRVRVPTRRNPLMPTYEYRCKSCGEQLEVVQSFTDDALTDCPNCGAEGQLRKVFGNIGITFKGSGFYKTDSRSGSSTSTSKK